MGVARQRHAKIGLVGAGMVGASFAYCLVQSDLANELVLYDIDGGRAEGEAMDLNHGLPFLSPMQIRAGSVEDLVDCAVVVVTAGANQRPGQTRLDLLKHNAEVIRDVVPRVVRACPEAILLIATNPVDLLTQIAAELACLPAGRVFGSGTLLDTARLRYNLGTHYGVDPRSVHASIIGEHGDSKIAVWSRAHIGGIPLAQFVGPRGQGYDREALERIFEQTRRAAYEVIQRKRATYYAIGLALLTIVRAILRDQNAVLTVSQPMHGEHGVAGISLSLPTVVGRDGASYILQSPMEAAEEAALQRSAGLLQELLAGLDRS